MKSGNQKDTRAKFLENQFYHVYNRANGDDWLFFTSANYAYFLEKLHSYLSLFLEIYAYCLIANHFHLLVKVKDKTNIPGRSNRIVLPEDELSDRPVRYNQIITQAFSNFFICYAKSINRQEHRMGSLFKKPFQRKHIYSDEYLKMIIIYIHLNPVHHQITNSFENYAWSSYRTLIDSKPTKLPREDIFEMFAGEDHFTEEHQNAKINYMEIAKYALE